MRGSLLERTACCPARCWQAEEEGPPQKKIKTEEAAPVQATGGRRERGGVVGGLVCERRQSNCARDLCAHTNAGAGEDEEWEDI